MITLFHNIFFFFKKKILPLHKKNLKKWIFSGKKFSDKTKSHEFYLCVTYSSGWLYLLLQKLILLYNKFINRNTRKRCEICSKLTIKIPERRQWCRSGIFIVNFEHIPHLCSSVSVVNLEHVIAGWDTSPIIGQRKWLCPAYLKDGNNKS